jgi:hypothetical protein
MRRDTSRNGRPATSAAGARARHLRELAQHLGVADVEPLRRSRDRGAREDRRVAEDLAVRCAPSPRPGARANSRRAARRVSSVVGALLHVDSITSLRSRSTPVSARVG